MTTNSHPREVALLVMRFILQRSVFDIDDAIVGLGDAQALSVELRLHDLDQALDHVKAIHNAIVNNPATERN